MVFCVILILHIQLIHLITKVKHYSVFAHSVEKKITEGLDPALCTAWGQKVMIWRL